VKQQVLTVLCMYVGYACFMILRNIPALAGDTLREDPSLGLTMTQWGRILAVGTAGGILGKFVGGWMADKLGGKFTFTLTLLITSIAVALFAMSPNVWFLGPALFLALLAKSAAWPSMAKLIDRWFEPNQYGRVWGILATSSRVGTIIATAGLATLLAWMSWRWALAVAAGVGALTVVYCALQLKERPPEESAGDLAASSPGDSTGNDVAADTAREHVEPHPLDGTTLPEAIRRFLVSRRFWLITGSLMGLTILWDYLFFLPPYLKDTLGIPSESATMATTAFPVGSFVSVLVGGYVFDKLDRAKMATVMGSLLTIATGCILTFYLMPDWGLDKEPLAYLSLGLLFVFGLCVSPCYYLPMSVFSIEFGGIHCAFLIALLDALGFGASMVFYYFGGAMVDSGGWDLFLGVLLAISVWSVVTTYLFLRGEARARAI
jgi:sugar phosphate permease